jgi:hypothetical protein
MGSFNDLQIRDKLIVIDRASVPSDNPPDGYVYLYTKDSALYMKYPDGSVIDLAAQDMPLVFSVVNGTGGTLTKGTIVTPDSATIIAKADCYVKDKSRILAVLQDDIAVGVTGYAIKLGQLKNFDTSSYSEGQILYLGQNGLFATTTPTDGGYTCITAVVDVVDATAGILTIDTRTNDLTVEVTDTNGFPPDQRAGTTISFDKTTRTFTIASTGSDFHYYQLGVKYEKTTDQTVVIDDTTGDNIIYFDGETLTSGANLTASQIESIILNKCFVASVYWNSADNNFVMMNDERHGISMSPYTHAYLHKTRGAQYIDGLALDNFVIGNGSLDSHAQFGNTSGNILDEDLESAISSNANTVGYTYLYRTGATGVFSKALIHGFAFSVGATPLPQFNEYTGSTWQLTEITSGNFMNIHLFASADINGKLMSVIGTAQYNSVSLADAGQANELTTILGSLPLPEFVLVGSVIIEGKTSFTNSVNAKVAANDAGDNYTNWTVTELAQGIAPTNHNNLAGLELAGTGVVWGHINNLLQTLLGKKIFSGGANAGSNSKTFSATPTFSATDGHVHRMPVTGNVVPTLSNKQNGDTYIIEFVINATGGYSITPDSTFGMKTDNSVDAVTSAVADAVYLFTVIVAPTGTTYYTIESIGL